MAENEEVARPQISQDDLRRMEQLSKEIAEFRKALAPRFEAISKELTELKCAEDVVALMAFEGKDTLKIMIKWDNKPLEVTFKSKRC